MLKVVTNGHTSNIFRVCFKSFLFSLFFFFFFWQQGSGQSQNESSNQSLCSLGSLSDKELEVSLSCILTGFICVDPSIYATSHTRCVYAAFFTDSREKGERAESQKTQSGPLWQQPRYHNPHLQPFHHFLHVPFYWTLLFSFVGKAGARGLKISDYFEVSAPVAMDLPV